MFRVMSAKELLRQARALPLRERRKFFDCVHELEMEVDAPPSARRKRRVCWPDVGVGLRQIFGDKVLPNLVLLARERY